MIYRVMTPNGYVLDEIEAYSDEEAAAVMEESGEEVIDVMGDIVVVPDRR